MTITPAEHPIFRQFVRYAGGSVQGFSLNFLGQRSNPTFGAASHPSGQAPIRRHDPSEAPTIDYPPVSEESFEWIAVLESVLEARETFTMFELGAGYGRWMVAAVCAARQKRPDLTFRLVGVEPEPTHFGYMRQHFVDNGLNPEDHHLIEAAVNATGKKAPFIVGHPEEWYGQAIVPEGFVIEDYPACARVYPTARAIEVPAVRLDDLLKPYDYVDLIDADIQGAELDVVTSSIRTMTAKARRAYISTHSADIHSQVAQTFKAAGWMLREIHGWTGEIEQTQFGPISFVDGIQYWLNPMFLRRLARGFSSKLADCFQARSLRRGRLTPRRKS